MTDTSVVVDKPALAVAQAPSFCRLCDVQLRGLQTWRAHVKSEAHVYKLRLKVAEPGSVTSPPSPPPSTDANQTTAAQSRSESAVGAGQDRNVDGDAKDEPSAPQFIPGNCLFCPQESDTLDDNMTHMAAAHGFTVPFQDCLAVDLETVVGYLHFVVGGYRECISCGARRATVAGVQQHMVAKGHCRFDVSADTEEFYAMPQSGNVAREQMHRDDGVPVRLPSGKLITQRRALDAQEPRAPRRAATPERDTAPLPSGTETPGVEVVQRGGNRSGEMVRSSEAILAAQLSRLRIAGDRVQQKEEARKRGRLEQANNNIWTKHFRLDSGDGRIGRKFCC